MGRNVWQNQRRSKFSVAGMQSAPCRLQLERLEERLAFAGMPEMVEGIHIDSTLVGLTPTAMVEANGLVYFAAKSATTTNALWKSDGTVAGTALVRDLYSGSSIESLTNVGGRLFFVSDERLWTSDGTPEGTQSLGSRLRYASSSSPYLLANVGGTLFFRGYDAAHGDELWRSDGTIGGTFMVADINPNQAHSNLGAIVDVDGVAYFTANSLTSGTGVWKSDGSLGGVELVVGRSAILSLTSSGQYAYFASYNGTRHQAWRAGAGIDGAQQITSASGAEAYNFSSGFTNVNGTMYFVAEGSVTGAEIWKVEESSEHATLLKDIHVNERLNRRRPDVLTNVDGTLYFTAGEGAQQLWKSDGTEAGTVAIGGPGQIDDRRIVVVGDQLFYRSSNALWTSDGTPEGTISLGNLNPALLTAVGSTVMFAGRDISGDPVLWQSDGTPEGTSEVGYMTLLRPNWGGPLVAFQDLGYFSIRNSLWRTDGTEAGTTLVFELNAGATTSWIRNLIEIDGVLYIGSDNGADEYQLWKSDGTLAGTELVHAIQETGAGRSAEFYNVNGTLMFVHAVAGQSVARPNYRLWSSDGTEAGTFIMRGLPNFRSYGGSQVQVVGEKLYLLLPEVADQLWQSDGTLAGTLPVCEFLGVPAGTQIGVPVRMDDALFFAANDGAHGWELWKKEGESAPFMLRDINPGAADALIPSTFAVNLHVAGNLVYMAANDGVHGSEPWRSDGTVAGTFMTADINPGSSGYGPHRFVSEGGKVHFLTFVDAERRTLWTTDGSLEGTYEIVALRQPYFTPSARAFLNPIFFDGMLYFPAYDDAHGLELWRSDGVSSVEFLGDLAVGDSWPRLFTEIDGKLLFFVTNDQTGVELYVIRSRADGGDYDGSGAVDGDDFLAWQLQHGAPASPPGSGADGDGDGMVGAGDLGVWRSNFGLKAPPSSPGLPAGMQAVAPAEIPALPTTVVVEEEQASLAKQSYFAEAASLAGNASNNAPAFNSLVGLNREPARNGERRTQIQANDERPLWFNRDQAWHPRTSDAADLDQIFEASRRDVSSMIAAITTDEETFADELAVSLFSDWDESGSAFWQM